MFILNQFKIEKKLNKKLCKKKNSIFDKCHLSNGQHWLPTDENEFLCCQCKNKKKKNYIEEI